MNYSDKLKDPRWQKKRLEIMGRSDFACEECGEKDKTLSVHHLYYKKGLNPWEYSNDSLRCLCEFCHNLTNSRDCQLLEFIYQFKSNLQIAETLTNAAYYGKLSNKNQVDFQKTLLRFLKKTKENK